MKKIYLLFAFVFTTFIYSQTSVEEYNYMVKGYQIQLSSGLDMKKGYSVENLRTILKGNYSFDFKALVRDDNTLAGVIVVSVSKSWGNTYYIGIPISNSTLTPYYENQVSQWDESMTTAYSHALTEIFADVLNNYALSKQNEE